MDSRILEIIFYLMEQVEESEDHIETLSDSSVDLRNLGYSEQEISSAYNFILDHLGSSSDSLYSVIPDQPGSSRILTEYERVRLEPKAHGLLLKLVHLGLLTNEQLEAILDKITLMSPRQVTHDQMKLIASAVINSDKVQDGKEWSSDPEVDFSSRIN